MYNIILFDLDGTLTDPKLGITKSVQYALAKLGIHEENLDSLVQFIGPSLIHSFQEFYSFDAATAKTAVSYYREYFSEFGIYENIVYDKIPFLLGELQKINKQLIVATTKPTVFAERIINHFNLAAYFNLVVGSNLDNTRNSKEEVIGYIFEEVKCEKESVVMIGDRKYDIIGAKLNGIDSIGVTYGYGSIEEIRNAEPTHIIPDVDGLIKLLYRHL